jgi:hypothetical protein
MSEPRYIVIPNWDGPDGFQHYRDRDPIWIKNYRALMAKDEYLELSFHVRGILHGLWLEYAASDRQLSDNTVTLSRRLGGRVTRRDLESLNHAGFIHFSASKPLAHRYQPASAEREGEIEAEDLTPEGPDVQNKVQVQTNTPSNGARDHLDDIPTDSLTPIAALIPTAIGHGQRLV